MAKVLISFLGTGHYTTDGKGLRQYRKATYRMPDGTEYQSAFIASALSRHHGIDKMFLIGTKRSMWEAVYEEYANLAGNIDDIYVELGDACNAATHFTPVEEPLPGQERLEQLMGKGSRIVLIKYGLNEEEIEYNSDCIMSLAKELKNGDEIVVDITHSFRSLPLVLMNALIYLQNVVKGITISHVYYGMLDVTAEMGFTPVVELNRVLVLNQWIAAAHSFKYYCNGEDVASLLKTKDPEAESRIKKFSRMMNINFLTGIKSQVQEMRALTTHKFHTPLAEMLVKPIVDDFIKKFGKQCSHARFQYELARWQADNMNYMAAYVTLSEAIVTFVCEKNPPLNHENEEHCKAAKTLIHNEKKVERDKKLKRDLEHDRSTLDALINRPTIGVDDDLRQCYFEILAIRNGLAHSKKVTVRRKDEEIHLSADRIINILMNAITNLNNVITD